MREPEVQRGGDVGALVPDLLRLTLRAAAGREFAAVRTGAQNTRWWSPLCFRPLVPNVDPA